MSSADLPIPSLRLVTYDDPQALGTWGAESGGGGREMYRLGLAWVAWRLRTGQINRTTAREDRYVISYFAEFLGDRRPAQVGASDCERWLASMRADHLAPGTIRKRWSTAKQFLEWLVDEGKIRRNPARRIPTPKAPRTVHRNLRADQATALHDACIDSRERLVVALGFQLGMRRAEIATAQVGDFDMVDRSVLIVGKGGHERRVAITEAAERAIADYLLEHGHNAGPLVRDVTGTRSLSVGYIGALFTRIAYRAGVKLRPWDGVASHAARHTAGTDVAHRSGNAVIVRDFLGHASLATTDIYVGAIDIEAQREAIEGRRYAS